jgi:hypothetical protein
MRILLKCPTRSRPSQFVSVLQKYVELANQPSQLGVCVSCDRDDATMTPADIQYAIKNVTHTTSWCKIFYENNRNKIEAVNSNMNQVSWEWDIVLLVSDDMVPQIKGYDDVIRSHMMANFPTTDGILWINDGFQEDRLNTITVMGRAMYSSFGYLYHPAYKSLFCDTEFTDLCKGSLASKCRYIPYVLIRHMHPGHGVVPSDPLYVRNQGYWNHDMHMYVSRKTYEYDWSILIPTIPGREDKLQHLLRTIHERRLSACPNLRIEICIDFDNREKTIGAKRQRLLQGAKGKYMSFIDDDDDVTAAYFEDALACIQGGFHVCRLRGQISQYTFTHSISVTPNSMMAEGDVFMRPPNHLNVMLTDVVRPIHFYDVQNGEDFAWSIRVSESGYLTDEYRPALDRIHYIYNLGDRTIGPADMEYQRTNQLKSMEIPPIYKTQGPPPRVDIRETGLRLSAKGFVSK